jgi:hypothetical protein
MNKILSCIRNWWGKHIISYCPPELEDDEFSDKYRN